MTWQWAVGTEGCEWQGSCWAARLNACWASPNPPPLPRLLPPAAESMDQHMLLAPAAWLQPHRCAALAQTALYCCVHARLISLLERCSSPGYVLLLLLLLLCWPGRLAGFGHAACRNHAAASSALRCCATPACLPAEVDNDADIAAGTTPGAKRAAVRIAEMPTLQGLLPRRCSKGVHAGAAAAVAASRLIGC